MAMSARQQTPVVPLEAGAGPDNPPCPACGEPLFGWIDLRAGLAGPVSRCESCGLGVVGEPGSAEDALRGLDPLTEDGETLRIVPSSVSESSPSRASAALPGAAATPRPQLSQRLTGPARPARRSIQPKSGSPQAGHGGLSGPAPASSGTTGVCCLALIAM